MKAERVAGLRKVVDANDLEAGAVIALGSPTRAAEQVQKAWPIYCQGDHQTFPQVTSSVTVIRW